MGELEHKASLVMLMYPTYTAHTHIRFMPDLTSQLKSLATVGYNWASLNLVIANETQLSAATKVTQLDTRLIHR